MVRGVEVPAFCRRSILQRPRYAQPAALRTPATADLSTSRRDSQASPFTSLKVTRLRLQEERVGIECAPRQTLKRKIFYSTGLMKDPLVKFIYARLVLAFSLITPVAIAQMPS